LDYDTADIAITVELCHDIHDLIYRCFYGQGDVFVKHADFFSGLDLHADVNTRIVTGTRLDYDKLGPKAGMFRLERSNPLGNLIAN